MLKGSIIVGLDIGSANIRAAIVQEISGDDNVRVLGVGQASSFGMRRGTVVDIEETARSVSEAIIEAQKTTGIQVKDAVISINGITVATQVSKGVIVVGRADGEITEDDINRVIAAAQAISIPPDREIIHVIPKEYRIDNQEHIKDPLGMHGVRLELDAIVVECSTPAIKNLTKSVEMAGVDIEDIILAPLAAAQAVLNKRQKELGAVLIDIGSGTTSLAVYEEGDLVHSTILPIGAGHITNDIAIGLRTSIDVAEKVKLEYGSAMPDEVDKREEIDLAQIDSQEEGCVSRYHVAEIIEARIEELFNLVQKDLKSINRAGLLPAGAILSGGGAKTLHIAELAKKILGLPVQIGYPQKLGGVLDKVDDPSFATAIGLALWAGQNNFSGGRRGSSRKIVDGFSQGASSTLRKVKGLFDRFLP
jgi:cell division protein FtsA